MLCSRCRQPNSDAAQFCIRCGAPVAASNSARVGTAGASYPSAEAAASASTLKPAGFFRRLFAFIMDALLLAILLALTSWVIGYVCEEVVSKTVLDPEGLVFERLHARFRLAGWAIGLLLPFLYFALLDWAIQGTLGKRLLGCRVANLAGQRTGLIRATLRTLLKPLSAAPLLLGFLLAGFTRRKQALHDLLSGSLVLKR